MIDCDQRILVNQSESCQLINLDQNSIESCYLKRRGRLHKSIVGLPKTSAPSFKKRPDRLSKEAALDSLVSFKKS